MLTAQNALGAMFGMPYTSRLVGASTSISSAEKLRALIIVLATNFLLAAFTGCFDAKPPAAMAPVAYRPSFELERAQKDAEDALAAYKQAVIKKVETCRSAFKRAVDDCNRVCDLYEPGTVRTKKEALERLDRQEKKALEEATADKPPTYQEVINRLSPECVREHRKECAVVEIEQNKTLDTGEKTVGAVRLLGQTDPVCGAATALADGKDRELHDADDRLERETDREDEREERALSQPRYPVTTSCYPLGSGVDCLSQ